MAAIVAIAAPKKVLFYEPLHNASGVAAQLVNANPQSGQEDEFANIGQGSDVWRPGHSNPAKDWNKKTTADFAAFDLIVIGDPGLGSVNNQLLSGAIANRSLWSAAVSGNVLIISGDPELHAALATEFIQQAIRFAANGPSSGPGLYMASGFLSPHSSPIDPFQKALPHLLDAFGTFEWVQPSGQVVTKLTTGPQLNCVSDADMSGWGTSAHGGFHDWPAPFIPFAMATDVPESLFTPAHKLPPDYRGLVHVLVRSDPADDQPRRYYVTPLDAGRIVNQQHTVTARI